MAQVMGQKLLWILVVLGNFVALSLQASTAVSHSYVAAVVEYAPVSGATLENKDEIFMQNVANYACFMEEAARQGADIIVFPEIGLASMGMPRNPDGTPSLAFYVPEPGSNPCNDNSSEIAEGLRELSCAVRRNGLYAVVNLPERVNCSGCPCQGFPATVDGEECPPAGAYFHNTNVAFDRAGTIVARYRKFNLYGEPGFVPTAEPEFATFDTDFGVDFGMFICFDIMFEKPAAALAREYGVCDFAFPTAWFSEAPFLTAVQAQAAWAYSLDVNLLASGYNKPEVGSAGSGIFLGRNGSLQWTMPNSTTSRLLVGTVPKMLRCKVGHASRSRSRRAGPGGGGYEDDDRAVERPPLSAFHHIVRQRKYGLLGTQDGESVLDEAAPAFIHHKMYDAQAEAAENDDDSQPPSGEYESKVPPHFMGLHQTDEVEDNGENENAAETRETESEGAGDGDEPLANEVQKTEEEENFSHASSPFGDAQKVDSPEKKIPGTTRTDVYDYSEPSQNPDLLRLYQDQDEPEKNQLPEEFLEIEVPEIYERHFEPERDQEYFKLPEEEVIVLPGEEKEESEELSQEAEKQQLLSTDDSAVAPSDSADQTVPLQEEKRETEENVDTVKEQATKGEQETSSDEERNTTQEEIEAALKKFEWLMEDKNDSLPHDSPEQEQNVPAAPSAGQQGEEAPKEEYIDETDDVLADEDGLALLHDGGQDGEAPGEGHIDDTDDVLADDHGLSELDDGGSADTDRKQEAKDTEELSESSEGDTLVDNKQATESEGESNEPQKCRKTRRRDRAKRNRRQPKCKPRPKEEKSAEEPDRTIADDQPVVETSEYAHEGVDEDTKSEGRKVTSSEPKRPCKPRERRASGCPQFRDGVLEDENVSKSTTGLYLKRDHLEVYKTFTLNTDTLIENSTVLLCDGTFCCNFHVVLEVNATPNQPRYAYRLAVFDGVRSFDGVATGGVQVCAVIPCSRDDMDSCGMLTLPDAAAKATVFRTISISGVFSTNHTLVTANTVVPGLGPLPADKFNMTSVPVADKIERVTLKTTAAVLEQGVSLFTFAIHSRVYNRDGEPATTAINC